MDTALRVLARSTHWIPNKQSQKHPWSILQAIITFFYQKQKLILYKNGTCSASAAWNQSHITGYNQAYRDFFILINKRRAPPTVHTLRFQRKCAKLQMRNMLQEAQKNWSKTTYHRQTQLPFSPSWIPWAGGLPVLTLTNGKRSKHFKGWKERYSLEHNMQIVGVIPFIRLQSTLQTIKQ